MLLTLFIFLQDTDISPAHRDEAVRWLTELHGRLQLYPETLVLAVSILDRFLAPIKVKQKTKKHPYCFNTDGAVSVSRTAKWSCFC